MADAVQLALLRWDFRSGISWPVESRADFLSHCEEWMAARLPLEERWVAWVVEAGGRAIGSVWCQWVEKLPNPVSEPELHAYLTNLFVREDARGFGAGSMLIEAVLDAARARHADKVFLWPTPKSRALYARHGFTAEDQVLTREAGTGD